MIAALNTLNGAGGRKAARRLKRRVGINTGEMILGNIRLRTAYGLHR